MKISKQLEQKEVLICPICKQNPVREHCKTCSKECSKLHNKAKKKAYSQKPEVKAKKKAYYQKPEVKAKMKAYSKAYYQRKKAENLK